MDSGRVRDEQGAGPGNVPVGLANLNQVDVSPGDKGQPVEANFHVGFLGLGREPFERDCSVNACLNGHLEGLAAKFAQVHGQINSASHESKRLGAPIEVEDDAVMVAVGGADPRD